MDYFNRSNDEELGGINYCSNDSTLTSSIISDTISNIDFRDLTIDKYDKAISDLSEKLENLTKKVTSNYCIISDLSEKLENLTKKVTGDYYITTEKIKNLFKQEKRSNKIRISEWREFDLEAATGREFETR